jgi:glycolate oxidase iron-sulfur subunit
MQTALADFIKDTPEGREADAILRKCVHCGFCTATCPTYQLLGDELDGPRGRIYLVKQVLEGATPTASTQLHLDRCLTCRACESTCPSGVEYHRLADIGRKIVDDQVGRPLHVRVLRRALAVVLPRAWLFAPLVALGRAVKPLLPAALGKKVPQSNAPRGGWPAPRHARKMLALAGCVQPALAPDINAAAARVLDRLGVSLLELNGAGCCGALRFHLNYQRDGLADMRALIDAWWPAVERGEVEAIVMTASGCGSTVKEYGHLLAHDAAYRDKAARISALTRDLSEVIAAELERPGAATLLGGRKPPGKLAFHPPCSLQHGQKIKGVTEKILSAAGFDLVPVADAHLCCGSAGTYSVLQPHLAGQLQKAKLAALTEGGAGRIATANIGCLSHLQAGSALPVEHWISALDRQLDA